MKVVLAEKVCGKPWRFCASRGWQVVTQDQLSDGLAAALADADASWSALRSG